MDVIIKFQQTASSKALLPLLTAPVETGVGHDFFQETTANSCPYRGTSLQSKFNFV